ncbi:unnamed protein product [[Candida] boidinii]|uniref:Unnamed protein product n=1 Tax=Candida boidinii TaxID=5477 RepID=A0ACB5U0W6_CANBO|nr:unnamed protein product [[Candida] boidinii]
MYLKTIQLNSNELNNVSKNTTPKSTHPSIGTYCVYNCFSKGDLRIRYQFPGTPQPTVQFFPSNSKKNMINIENSKSELWIESYVSGIIRSILFGDDISRQLPGMCKFNPFTSTNSAKEAVKLLVKYIPKGILVGCSDLINQPSLICNNLIDSLIELLKITELYELAINSIYELEEFNQNEQYQILIVKIMILQGEQLKAVEIMYKYLKLYPRDGLMLNEQAKYLLSKNRSDLALIPSKRSVESLPGEFECWSTLVECYIMLKDYSNALLSLNSCPMYSTKKKDIFKAIKPADFSFPFPVEGSYSKIWKDAEDMGCMSGLGGIVEFSPLVQVENVNPIYLQVYNSVKLHSTFKKAYDFLSIIARQKGWSELLRLRSNSITIESATNWFFK